MNTNAAASQDDYYLFDVRSPSELDTLPKIPTAKNIPANIIEQVFSQYDDEDFEDEFGIEKPNSDSLIVLYCNKGIRSHFAAKILRDFGYRNVYNYEGSIQDWYSNDD